MIFGKSENVVSKIFQDGNSQEDNDNDGLKNWEEDLWRTDKNNSDTDGDGTNDGQEVKDNRNPLKPGPEDTMEIKFFAPSVSTENLSETEKISRRFFAEYLTLKQSGGLTEEKKSELINSFLSGIGTSADYKTYKISDIKISGDNSVEAIKKYGDNMEIILSNFDGFTKNELDIINEALDADFPEKLDELVEYANAYGKSAGELLKIECPYHYSQYHIDLINNFMATEYAVLEMKKIFEDPLLAMAGLKFYFEQAEKIKNIFSAMAAEFYKSGVYPAFLSY